MENRSKYINIPGDISNLLADEDSEKDALELTKWAHGLIKTDWRDGDCLVISRNCYRNDGKFLWDAQENKVIPFGYDLDDYGCIPKDFNLRRFSARFFENILDHNYYVRLDKDLINQIVRHAVYDIDKMIVWSYFMLRTTKYTVIGLPQDCLYMESLVVEETERRELVIAHEEMIKYEKSSQEYPIHFMRVFISRVMDEAILFQDPNHSEHGPPNTLFVLC